MDKTRRYDLDWLRVIVFGLLIFYHVGMFFVPWGWHVKNNVIYPDLRWPMMFLNQWRLPLLFVISGMGTAYALSFRTGGQFARERLARLGLPLVFGMLAIIPPQIYFERLYQGSFQGSLWQFITGPAFTTGVYPEGNISWHHLWFLPYLLVFSVILVPAFLYLRSHPECGLLRKTRQLLTDKPLAIFWLVVPLYLYEALLEPFFDVTHNLFWDWFNFASSLTLFFYGYLLIRVKEAFWPALSRIRSTALLVGILAFAGQSIIWLCFEDGVTVHFIEALLKVVNLWAWILAIFGYAALWLNRPGKFLAYANQAVYPFYILHQTITVALGYYLHDLPWAFWSKFAVLVIGTFGISWIIYEGLIRRVRLLWPLFGLKPRE